MAGSPQPLIDWLPQLALLTDRDHLGAIAASTTIDLNLDLEFEWNTGMGMVLRPAPIQRTLPGTFPDDSAMDPGASSHWLDAFALALPDGGIALHEQQYKENKLRHIGGRISIS